jgi:histidyl-tRNA synthetase
MKRVEPRVLKGFRDYLPARMIPRQRMLASIESTFQRFGYLPLMTPALEALDILTGKYGGEGEGLLYRFKDLGDRDVALRYDLTVPLARVVAQYPGEVSLPFRRYQIAPVWRAEKPARGRFREFVQCDADIAGSGDMLADAEMVELAGELLRGLGVERFRIQVNNRKVLSGLMSRAGITSPESEAGVLRTMDKLDKIGADKVRELLRDENGLTAEQVRQLDEFLAIRGEPREVIEALRPLLGGVDAGRRGVEELSELFRILEGAGLGGAAAIDLSIARGLSYYTGTIYEVFLRDLPGFGAVAAGGRYDSLIGVFKGEEIPAVGISLGIDRLLEGLVELGLLKEEATVARVLVTVFDAAQAPYAARAARALRAAGVPCELYPACAKLKKQLRQAERSGQRWVVLAGPDEAAEGVVAVKDLETRTQESVPLDGLGAYLERKVREVGGAP